MLEILTNSTTTSVLLICTFISLVSFIILYVVVSTRVHKQTIDMLVKNASQFMEKIEETKTNKPGEKKMDDVVKLAKYLTSKIEAAKEEILTRLDDIEANLVNEEAAAEEDIDTEDFDFFNDEEEQAKPKKQTEKQELDELDNKKEKYKGKRQLKADSDVELSTK